MRKDDELRHQCKIKIRKNYVRQVKYSDIIGKDRKTIRLWRLVQTRLYDRRVDTRKIRRLMQLVDQPNALRMTHAQVDAAQTTTDKLYKEHKKIQTKLRNEFSSKVNQRRAKKYKTSEEAQNKITKNAFRSKQCFRRINAVLEKKVRATITFVESTDAFGIVTESTSTEDIYQACKAEGQARYDQANSTPFMSTALLDAFGTLGNQEVIEQVLNGIFTCPDDTPPYTKKFIQELKKNDNLDNPGGITGHTSTADFTKSWKKMRVYTAASPFGPSFSEIITGTTNDPDIADANAALLSIATLAGVIPLAWTTAIDVMIPKKKLSRHVTKL
jgi:hypothetical protein